MIRLYYAALYAGTVLVACATGAGAVLFLHVRGVLS